MYVLKVYCIFKFSWNRTFTIFYIFTGSKNCKTLIFLSEGRMFIHILEQWAVTVVVNKTIKIVFKNTKRCLKKSIIRKNKSL